MNLSRRNFIRGASSLAALTVVATKIPFLLKEREIAEQIKTGIVENQTFYISEPIVIDMDNLIIRNCKFIATRSIPYMFQISGKNISLHDCQLDCRKMAHVGMHYPTLKKLSNYG